MNTEPKITHYWDNGWREDVPTVNDTIEHEGERYRFYAGPFADQIDAFDRIAVLVEYGSLAENDAIVIGNSIYTRDRENV